MSCMIPEFYDERRVLAKKAHVCDECGRAVPVGAFYVRIAGKWEGDFSTHVQHVECRDFAAKVNLDYFGDCEIGFGCVNEAMSDGNEYDIAPEPFAAYQAEWQRIRTIYPEANR